MTFKKKKVCVIILSTFWYFAFINLKYNVLLCFFFFDLSEGNTYVNYFLDYNWLVLPEYIQFSS